MEYIYTAEAILDASVHREFSLGYLYAKRFRALLYPVYSLFMLYFITQYNYRFFQHFVLFFSVFFLVEAAVHNNKKGNIQYKRSLTANNGEPPTQIYHFYEDRINGHNPNTNANVTYHYDQFLSLIETKNLLILLMKYQLCLVIEKNKITGGSADDLAGFLLTHCTNAKPRKLRKTNFGKWSHRFLLVVSVICCILALLNLSGLPVWAHLNGRLHNNMSYQEMAAELEPLGITISSQTIYELEAYDLEYAEEYGSEYYQDNYYDSKILDLLYWEGSGFTNYETYEWTPSRSGIYWIDIEVMNVNTMYTDLLTGIAAMNEELSLSEIYEDYTNADIETGIGTVSVSFTLNDQHVDLTADYYFDWMDTDVLCKIGHLLSSDDYEKDLYFASDEGQGFYFYYGYKNHISSLNRKTGLNFQILNEQSVLY